MAFVQIDGNGAIVGIFARPQADPAPEGYAEIADDDARLAAYAAAQASKATCAQITGIRDARLAAGFADTAAGGTGKTFQCDPVSLAKWDGIGALALAAVLTSANPVPSFEIICADNSIITLAAPAAQALFQLRVAPWVSATMIYARVMKNNLLAGQAPNSQNDVTAGWP